MIQTTVHESLLKRRLAEKPRDTRIRTLYGNQGWVDDLDIINELGGHTGCVNALSWSRSGRFLASGSDDTYLNIWEYNSESGTKPFTLNTSVSTGHTANIFGVKFAPHSNDRTVITCAGDSQVRVFDIEYGGNYSNSGMAGLPDSTRSRRFHNFFSNARFLNEGNTNARVYRSHSDRAKRIVTESSPYTFLTCSEDGEVRQWDLRLPSSAYPAPRGGQGFRNLRPGNHDAGNVPEPLISYKKYSLDLNSISCAASQPYYIALAGAHLHCFLHDRRMLGRDLLAERGQLSTSPPSVGSHDDYQMDQATRCVRRFAPNDQFAMGTHDNGHITACRISDANPNELIASWSGDHIYSFDIVESPDAREASCAKDRTLRQRYDASRKHQDRKRKRATAASSTNPAESAKTRVRSRGSDQEAEGELSLMIRFGNGESETIPVGDGATGPERGPDFLLGEAQRLAQRIAKGLVALRKTMFDFGTSMQDNAAVESSSERTPYTAAFTTVLGQAAVLLPQIDEVIRDWSYPVNPSPEEVRFQNTLRRNRQASRRFVQASGCLAAAMGGRFQTLSAAPDPRMSMFERIEPAQREGAAIDDHQRFSYDFLKAILLWLMSGRDAVIEGFRKRTDEFRDSHRFPLDPDDGPEGIDSKLVPYLLNLAREDKPILNVDANRFQTDESRSIFRSQVAAVNAFIRVLKGPTLSGGRVNVDAQSEPASPKQTLDLGAACRFWGVKVGRSLLMEAGEGVNYEFVKRAFGGLQLSVIEDVPADRHAAIDEDDGSTEATNVIRGSGAAVGGSSESAGISHSTSYSPPTTTQTDSTSHDTVIIEAGGRLDVDDATEGGQDDEDDDDDDDDDAGSSNSDRAESDDEFEGPTGPLFRRVVGFGRSKERGRVEIDKPYRSHTRVYKGHCNTATVKGVSYYGLNDEYVMSGSDSGHVFIWDRKTAQLVNILEGDGEVVNCAVGHPDEPMIAASGIDSTIKIFSADERLQEDARQGTNIANPPEGAAGHSSLRIGVPRRRASRSADTPVSGPTVGLTSKKAMQKVYEITSQNDVQRTEGTNDAFITRGMLNRLAAHLRSQGDTGEGTVVIDDQCLVM